MGRKKSELYNLFYDKCLRIYDELDLEENKVDYIIQNIDLDLYYHEYLDVESISKKYLSLPIDYINKRGIHLRLA